MTGGGGQPGGAERDIHVFLVQLTGMGTGVGGGGGWGGVGLFWFGQPLTVVGNTSAKTWTRLVFLASSYLVPCPGCTYTGVCAVTYRV